MKSIIDIYKKQEEIINYIIVGIATTIVSLFFYYVSTRTFLDINNPIELQAANLIKWTTGVLFAYVTNRIFVFKSKTKSKEQFKEFSSFVMARFATLFLDMGLMMILVTYMQMYDMLAAIISIAVVTIVNYFLSKIFIFKN